MAIFVPYDAFLLARENGNALDFDTGSTLKIALVTAAYTWDQAAHDFFNDAEAAEVTGTGYTAGGEVVANKALGVSAHVVTLTCDPVSWAQEAGGFANATQAILYNDTGTPSTSRLVARADLGGAQGNVDGALTFTFTTGLFKSQIAA